MRQIQVFGRKFGNTYHAIQIKQGLAMGMTINISRLLRTGLLVKDITYTVIDGPKRILLNWRLEL